MPLRRIYTLVSQDNVYANKQEYDNPIFMDFDLTNQRCWKPFFDQRYNLDLFYPEGISHPDSKWSLQRSALNNKMELEYVPTMPFSEQKKLEQMLQSMLVEKF